MKNKRKIIAVVLVIITVLRVGLFARMPYYAIGESGYDDSYLLHLAANIGMKKWLGTYNYTTLIKGVSFPAFVVLSNTVFLPYPIMLGAFYVLAASVFAFACKKLLGSTVGAACIYAFMLYSPAGFSSEITQRLYRNAIVFPCVLLVVGCILMVYAHRTDALKKQLPWLILLGFSFSFFYYIREDSFWL